MTARKGLVKYHGDPLRAFQALEAGVVCDRSTAAFDPGCEAPALLALIQRSTNILPYLMVPYKELQTVTAYNKPRSDTVLLLAL